LLTKPPAASEKKSAHFTCNLRNVTRPAPYNGVRVGSHIEDNGMLQWLVDDWHWFGLSGQNWLLVIGGGLALYIAGMLIARRRPPRLR